MKAMEISRYGQHDARSRLVRFSTELLKLIFQTRSKIWREQSCFYNELSALTTWLGREGSNLRMAESKSAGLFNEFNAHLEKKTAKTPSSLKSAAQLISVV
jgi:hypothetical protein